MLLTLLVFLVTAFTTVAEQVSCKTGQAYCNGSQSLSVVNNNYFCCDNGFNLQWKNEVSNDTSLSSCVCNRHFYESDCIEGQRECTSATSVIFDGAHVRCCTNGYYMNSASNSFVNGVRVDYCKCIRYINNIAGGSFINAGGVFRPMTDAERTQFTSSMNQFSQDLQARLNQMAGTLGHNLGLFDLDRGQNRIRPLHPINWAANFLEGLGQNLRNFNQILTQHVPPTSNVLNRAPNVALTSPRPMWDIRQKRFQQLQRRLQSRTGLTFLDRLASNPLQIMSPGMWTRRNRWTELYDNTPNQFNSTTQTVRDNNNTNDGAVGATSRYSTLPVQNVNTTA